MPRRTSAATRVALILDAVDATDPVGQVLALVSTELARTVDRAEDDRVRLAALRELRAALSQYIAHTGAGRTPSGGDLDGELEQLMGAGPTMGD